MENNIISYLYERTLIDQIIKKDKLKKLLHNGKNINIYCGIDPTSDSLHIGHLSILMYIINFIKFNYNFTILIGNSTGLIGDPSFLHNKRKFINKNTIIYNSKKIKNQILNILDSYKNNINILFNSKWLSKISIIDFLYKIGINFSISKLLKIEFIKNRIKKKKNKISFTEFSYILLQSYDFMYLYNNFNINLQIGGSDQWNNILYGIKLIKKIYKKDVYGITFPILSDNNNVKFSKSLNNNIWLDKNKTSVYDFYQFWINISDVFLFNALKKFTNISIIYINKIIKENNYKNIILEKKKLAKYLTNMIHGKSITNLIIKITNNLFNKEFKFYKKDFDILVNKIYTVNLKIGTNLKETLIKLKIASSNKIAKNIIKSNSIKINNILVSNVKYIFSENDILYKKYTLLKKGKKDYYLIIWDKLT